MRSTPLTVTFFTSSHQVRNNVVFGDFLEEIGLKSIAKLITFSINRELLEGGLSVSEAQVKDSIIQLAEKLKIVVEPGGAVAAAALLNKKLEFENKNIVVLISGGNMDYSFFSNIIKKK